MWALLPLFAFIYTCDHQTTYTSHNRATYPKRIISLKPNITEILFALNVGDKVVGITTWCDRPLAVKKLPKVADYININTEKIMALKPDLIIGSEENSVKEPFDVLKNAGIGILVLPFRTIDDLYSSIEKIADAMGKKEAGEKLVKHLQRVIASEAKQSHTSNHIHEIAAPPSAASSKLPADRRNDISPARILILVGHRPLIAASQNTFYGDIIKLIGAKNIVESLKTPYPSINTEFILAKNPDVIIDMAMGSEAVSELPEILRKRVIQLDISDFRAGPRIGEAVKKLRFSITNNQAPNPK